MFKKLDFDYFYEDQVLVAESLANILSINRNNKFDLITQNWNDC